MFKYLILLNALALSAVAAYYSILGLITIFSAAAIPVAVMGTSLEVGKLVTATFLHNHWKQINWLLKTYLTAAVVVLMVITSLGIFGLLSKANIDANLTVNQAYQRIEQIDRQIVKLNEQQSISDAQYQKAAERNLTQSNNEIDILRSQLRQSQSSLETLDTAVQLSDVKQIQTTVGVVVDGRYGPNTEKSVKAFRLNEQKKIDDLNDRIRTLNDRLQDQQVTVAIVDNTKDVQKLVQERFATEKELTELEAEVGPIKYISELVYNSSESTTMEDAVRWMIIVIVAVFDPLAISLLLAFNSLNKKEEDEKTIQMVEKPIQKETRSITDEENGSASLQGSEEESYDLSEYYEEDFEEDSEEELVYWKKVVKEQPIEVAPKLKMEKPRGKVSKARKNLT